MADPGSTAGSVRRIYANLGRLLGGKAVGAAIGVANLAIAARVLGARDYGVLVLVHGFAMAVGGIMEFPCWHAILRYGREALHRCDEARLVRLLRLATLVEAAGGTGAVLVAALLGPRLGPSLGWSATAVAFAVPYSFATLASIRSVPAGYLQLAGRYDLLAAHASLPAAVRLAGALVAMRIGAGLHGFLVAWLVAAVAEWAALWGMALLVARRRLAGRLIGSPRGAVAENPRLWRFMIGANADTTFADLAGRLAPLVVGWMLGPAMAGLYAVAQRATVVISQPAQILGRAAYAELAALVARGGTGAMLRRAVFHAIRVALMIALPVLLVVALFGGRIAVLLGGRGFAGAGPLMLWLAAAQALLLATPPMSAALVALGRPGLSLAANVAANLVLLPALPVALLSLGLVGAGVQAVAQAIAATVVLAGLLRRITREPAREPIPAPG